ncbi:MAG: FHA domain-containing protein [Planctomycetes bacterium]|nr:FHA domain-containing protein [Planctomycetota bacterium]
MTLGRRRGNRCRLTHVTVSRLHAVVKEERGRWILYNVAADNPIQIELASGQTRTLKEDGAVPLQDRLVLLLGEVRCSVTRDGRGVKPPSSMFRREKTKDLEAPEDAGAAPARGGVTQEHQPLPGLTGGAQEDAPALVASPAGPPPDAAAEAQEAVSYTSTIELSGEYEDVEEDDALGVAAARPRLLILEESDRRIVSLLDFLEEREGQLECMLGRKPDRGGKKRIVVDDDSVSEKHAALLYRGGRFYVIDKTSRNGTWIGARWEESEFYSIPRKAVKLPPERPEVLRADTHLRFGSVHVLFVVDSDEGDPVDFEPHTRALEYLEADADLTSRQRRDALKKARREREKHAGVVALRDCDWISLPDWVLAYRKAVIVPPPRRGLLQRLREWLLG